MGLTLGAASFTPLIPKTAIENNQILNRYHDCGYLDPGEILSSPMSFVILRPMPMAARCIYASLFSFAA